MLVRAQGRHRGPTMSCDRSVNTTDLISIVRGERRSATAGAMRCGLAVLEPFYRGAVAGRNLLFDLGVIQPARLSRPVISVGNLTVGGTGKTPVVVDVVHRLRSMGHHPAVLLRGYAPGAESSDEAAVLVEESESDLPIGVAPDRAAAARAVIGRRPEVSIFVLDDGFQHRQVHRDLNLALIDATDPFGLGRLLPRGLLREPPANLRRADAVVVTHAEQVDDEELSRIDREIENLTGRPPLAHAEHRWTGWRRFDGERLGLEVLDEASVSAFCGLGNPRAFGRLLSHHVGDVLDLKAFADHYPYASKPELVDLIEGAANVGAEAIVTSVKDWVKIRSRLDWAKQSVPLLWPVLEITFRDGEARIDDLLRKCAEARRD